MTDPIATREAGYPTARNQSCASRVAGGPCCFEHERGTCCQCGGTTPSPTEAQQRALVQNLTPGHMAPHDFYDHCRAEAERIGTTAYDVAFHYALGVIGND